MNSEYKFYSNNASEKNAKVLAAIGPNASSNVKAKARAFSNALKNADASVSAFEICLEGWNGTKTVEEFLKNELLDFNGRIVTKERVALVLRQIEVKYDFPADSYAVEALNMLANDLKMVTHMHNNLMVVLGKLELPKDLEEE